MPLKTLIALLLLPFFSHAQIINTIVGKGIASYSGDGGNCLDANLNTPQDVAIDRFGNLFIADKDNHVVRKVTPHGIISTFAGNNIMGYGGDGGPATSAKLNTPTSITLDTIGNLYIADFFNHVIRKVDISGVITTIAGTPGMVGYTGDGGPATLATFSTVYAITSDKVGNIFVSDYGNHVIRKISSGMISTVAGNGTSGYSGDGGPATLANLQIPGYLKVDDLGNIYIPDWTTRRLRKVNNSGIISTIAGDGTTGYTGDGGLATSASLTAPNSVAIDKLGNIYIGDPGAYVVRKINQLGIISTIAGNGTTGFSGDGGNAILAQIGAVGGMAFSTAGNVVFADASNNRIRKIFFTPEDVTNINPTLPSTDIFPNPATDNITISAGTTIITIELLNTLGQVVSTATSSTYPQQATFSVSHLPAGIYFARVNGINVGKVVKQ